MTAGRADTIWGRSEALRERFVSLDVGIPGGSDCEVTIEQEAVVLGLIPLTINVHRSGAPVPVEVVQAAIDRGVSVREGGGSKLPVPGPGVASGTVRSKVLGETFLQQIRAGQPHSYPFDVEEIGQVKVTAMWNRAGATLAAEMTCQRPGEMGFDAWATSLPLQDRVIRLDTEVPEGATCEVTLSTDKTAVYAVHFASYRDVETLRGTVAAEAFFPFTTEISGQHALTLAWEDPDDQLRMSVECDGVVVATSSSRRDRFRALDVGIPGGQACFVTVELESTVDGAETFRLNRQTSESPVVAPAPRAVLAAPLPENGTASEKVLGTTVLQQVRPGQPSTYTFEMVESGALRLTSMWNRAGAQLSAALTCEDPADPAATFAAVSAPGLGRVLRLDAEVPAGLDCEITFSTDLTAVFAAHFALASGGDLAGPRR